MGAIVSLSIVCLWKKRNYEESIKVDRLKGSAYSKKNIATQLTRSSNFENGARYLGPNQARKHIYRKNQPVHNGGSPRRFPESPRRSRTPHSQAQHSAMFVVNEGEQRTLHPLPTEQKGTKKPILKRSAKEEQERSKSLKIARTALVQFEGERLHAVGSSSHRDELFDANNQRMSNINASLRGMGKRFVHSDPNINNPNQTSSKKGKKKEKMKELPGSIWSIDYEHFEMPVGADPKLEEESQPSQTPRSVGHRSETSIEDNEQTLREYDIDPAALKPVDEFAEELPITNIDELNNFFDQKPQTESILDESLKCFDSESSSDSDTMSSLSLVKTRSPEELLEENSELSDIEDIKYGLTTGSCEKRRDSVESYDYAVVKRDWSGKMSEFTPPDQDLNIPVSNIDDYADPPELPPHPDKASTLPLDAYEEVQQQYRTLDSISVGTLKQQQGADSYWYGDTPL
ncbi:uncharacterized protein [Watersipora subatra]|uniref:uncharacterized protein n=1 Tax=Watersipora subatra TaxID=2589382 RepID=UPI00355C450A